MQVESIHVKSFWSTGECYRPASEALLLANSWHYILMRWRSLRHPTWWQRRAAATSTTFHAILAPLLTMALQKVIFCYRLIASRLFQAHCLSCNHYNVFTLFAIHRVACQAVKVRFILCDNCSLLSQASIRLQDFRISITRAQNNTVLEVKGKMMCLRLQWSFHKCVVQALERLCIKSGKKEMRQLSTIKAKKVALWQWLYQQYLLMCKRNGPAIFLSFAIGKMFISLARTTTVPSLIVIVMSSGVRITSCIIGCIQPTIRCVTTEKWEDSACRCKLKTYCMKLLEERAFFSSPVCKHSSVFEVVQVAVIMSKFKKSKPSWSRKPTKLSPDRSLQRRCVPSVKTCPFKEVHLLWMCGVLWLPVLVLCQRQPQAVVLQWSSASGVQESDVRLFGAGVLYEDDGNFVIFNVWG